MHRCSSGFLLTLAITFVAAFTGCLGKSSSNPGNGGVQSVTLGPSSIISLETGGTQVFSATAKDALGRTVLGIDIQFIVGVPAGVTTAAPLSIAGNGSACAGTWDPTATQCTPGSSGIATVTAVASGHSSAATTVYVHQHVDSIQIKNAESQDPQYDCFPQGQTWLYQAVAYDSNGVDISNTVGPISWLSSNPGVVTAIPTVPKNQPNVLNQVQTTAKFPGITQLFASIFGASSAPFPYTTCLIKAIYLQIGGQPQAGNSITVNNGGGVPVTATAIDTLFGIAPGDNAPLASPPLTWSTTNPEVAAFSTTTNTSGSNNATARANLGGATLTASCSPPSCNIGVLPGLPIYASDGKLPNGTQGFGVISVDVTSTSKVPIYTAWAATTDCANAVGCTSALFSMAPTTSGTNAVGSIVSLPWTPNSMMFNHASSPRLYIGSDVGLMFVDVTATNPAVTLISNSTTPCNVVLCGKVLAISNDGKLVVISDRFSTPNQVYIFDGGGANPTLDLVIPGDTATAAAFSPDQLKLFILTSSGKMYVHSTVDALTSVPVATSVTDVKFSADGTFAYVAGNPAANSISGFATCDNQPTHATSASDSVTTPGIPLQIFPSPDGQHVLVLDPSNGSIDVFTTTVGRQALPDGQFVCNAQPPFVDIDPTVNFPQTAQSFDLGQGKNFTPIYAQLVNDGAAMIIVGQGIPAVLLFNVSDGTTSSVPLSGSPATGCPQCAGNSFPLSASASSDGSQVYIAACDQYDQTTNPPTCSAGSVHIVNTCGVLSCNTPPALGLGDFQQVPYVNINQANNPNMCNSQGGANPPLCLPNLVALRPQ